MTSQPQRTAKFGWFAIAIPDPQHPPEGWSKGDLCSVSQVSRMTMFDDNLLEGPKNCVPPVAYGRAVSRLNLHLFTHVKSEKETNSHDPEV